MKSVSVQELKALSTVTFIAFTGMLGIDLHLASVPSIMAYLHTDKQHMQQSVAIFLLGMGGSILFYGPISDKYGRKPLVIFGLALAALACFFSVFTTHINTFLLARLIEGIGAGVCMGLGRTIMVDVLQGERMAIVGAYPSLVISLAPLIAPALGGYIQHWLGWQGNFIVWGCLLLLALVLYAALCPETNKYKNPHALALMVVYNNYKSLLVHPIFVASALLTGISVSSTMVYVTISPFIFQVQFHLTPVAYGWLAGMASLGGIIGKLISPVMIQYWGGEKTLYLGLLSLLGAGLWMVILIFINLINVPLILVAVFISIFSQALIMPIAGTLALSQFHDKRGAASALYGGFQMLTAFAASAIAGALASNGAIILMGTYCILGFIGIVVHHSMMQIKQRQQTTDFWLQP